MKKSPELSHFIPGLPVPKRKMGVTAVAAFIAAAACAQNPYSLTSGRDAATGEDAGEDTATSRDAGADVAMGEDAGGDVVIGRDAGMDVPSPKDAGSDAAGDVVIGRDAGMDVPSPEDGGSDAVGDVPVPEPDRDGDGVPDSRDFCDTDPALLPNFHDTERGGGDGCAENCPPRVGGCTIEDSCPGVQNVGFDSNGNGIDDACDPDLGGGAGRDAGTPPADGGGGADAGMGMLQRRRQSPAAFASNVAALRRFNRGRA